MSGRAPSTTSRTLQPRAERGAACRRARAWPSRMPRPTSTPGSTRSRRPTSIGSRTPRSCRRSSIATSGTCPAALDVDAMRRGAQALLGRHDFAAFQSIGGEVHTTERTILVDWRGVRAGSDRGQTGVRPGSDPARHSRDRRRLPAAHGPHDRRHARRRRPRPLARERRRRRFSRAAIAGGPAAPRRPSGLFLVARRLSRT